MPVVKLPITVLNDVLVAVVEANANRANRDEEIEVPAEAAAWLAKLVEEHPEPDVKAFVQHEVQGV